MDSRTRHALAPVYLLACLVLGGSAQGIWANMVLQLAGIAILAWAAGSATGEVTAGPARQLLILAMLGLGLVMLQLLPLPPAIWTHLGGRALVAEGYRILGLGMPWIPLSLTPARSLDSMFGIIPPLAIFIVIVRLDAYRPAWLVAALLAGTIAGVLLGVLQVAVGGNIASSHWYLYPAASYGLATGFFANANHMASLLVCTLPFLAALVSSARGPNRQRSSAILLGAAVAALLVLAGIGLNHSLAVYGLTLPVLVASVMILLPSRSRWRRRTFIVGALLLVLAIAGIATNVIHLAALGDAGTSVESRQEMLGTTARALRDFLPWGSGLGSFQSVYRLYENPTLVNGTYVIHAHNDYAELALELGVAGILLILLFLLWWIRQVKSAWTDRAAGPFARAASVASAAILTHSLVDFPLRTAAISAVFAMCLALLVERRSVPVRSASDLRPTRHVVVR